MLVSYNDPMGSKLHLAFVALLPLLAHTQTQPAFDVASIKPTQHHRDANGFSRSLADVPSPGRFVGENSSLDELIRFAYNLMDYQVSGPKWLNDESVSFDIIAKASPETPKTQMRVMLQTLLRERFKLAAHPITKILPIYELVVDKGGPKLNAAARESRRGISSGGGDMIATRVTMAFFAEVLSRDLKRPVVDKTGLAGAFDSTSATGREKTASPPTPRS
jgi:uncharacterized protein (TIGR03435 family)